MLSPRWDAVQRKLPQDDRRAPPTPPANVDLVLTGKVKRAVLEQYNQVRKGPATKSGEISEKCQRGWGVIFNPKIYVADFGNFR